jgi:hypothetical protein
MNGGEPRLAYETRRDRFEALRAGAASRSRTLSHARLAAFLLLLASGVIAELRPGGVQLLVTVLLAAVFIALIVAHQRVRRQERWWETLRDLNRLGLARLARDWDALPPRRPHVARVDGSGGGAGKDADGSGESHAYAEDLDLFGSPALAQLLGPASTPAGREILSGWLLAPSSAAVLRERHAAVRELAPLTDLRDELAALAMPSSRIPAVEIERFLAWAEDEPALRIGALRIAAFVVPLTTVALVVADITGIIGPALWIFPLLAAAAITFGPGRALDRTFRRAFGREGLFRAYPELLERAASIEPASPALQRLREVLTVAGVPAYRQLGRLRRLMHLADIRHSGSVYVIVQLLTLWDVHVMVAVERWRQESGARVRRWLDAVGEIEALAALATLAHDHPDWCLPEIVESGEVRFAAELAGHPMIADDVRVDNDVEVGPPGTFLLITGSNMSGKSTLLRAIGANAVLALAGGPVCARRMTLHVVSIRTSIRVADSVVRGVSYFMAQLERMREIVRAAEHAATDGWPVLYLLDEILQGTNTAERRIAATHVIRHLVEQGAIGAVTTHDLELAGEPALLSAVVPVHFTETISGSGAAAEMTFDHRLRPGVATSTNALRLMEMVGLRASAGDSA